VVAEHTNAAPADLNPEHLRVERFVKNACRSSSVHLRTMGILPKLPIQFSTRTASIERTSHFDESGGVATKNPHVRGCFPKSGATSPATPPILLSRRSMPFRVWCCRLILLYRLLEGPKVLHPWLWSGRHEGTPGLWHIWLDVLHQSKQQSIRDIRREVRPRFS
jgi:hypothetical protein